jgi:hypothetical protein
MLCSEANAKSLAETLPVLSGEGGRVLYPSSAKASHELGDRWVNSFLNGVTEFFKGKIRH